MGCFLFAHVLVALTRTTVIHLHVPLQLCFKGRPPAVGQRVRVRQRGEMVGGCSCACSCSVVVVAVRMLPRDLLTRTRARALQLTRKRRRRQKIDEKNQNSGVEVY